MLYNLYFRSDDYGWQRSDIDIADEQPVSFSASSSVSPSVSPSVSSSPSTGSQGSEDNFASQNYGRRIVEEKLRQKIHVRHFGGKAGAVLETNKADKYGYTAYANHSNVYAPFASELDWQVAKWAKLRGPGSNAFSELLKIPEVSNYIILAYLILIFAQIACEQAWTFLSHNTVT